MKIILKTFLWLAAFAAVATLAVLAVVLSSASLQTQIARHFISQSMQGADIKLVKLGFSEFYLEDFRMTAPDGTSVFSGKVSGKYSLSKLIDGNVDLESLDIDGAKIVLAQRNEPAAAQPKSAQTSAAQPRAAAPAQSAKTAEADAKSEFPQILLGALSAKILIVAPDKSEVYLTMSGKQFVVKNLRPEQGSLSAEINAKVAGLSESYTLKSSLLPEGDNRVLKTSLEKSGAAILKMIAGADAKWEKFNVEARLDIDKDRLYPLIKVFVPQLPEITTALYVKARADAQNVDATGAFRLECAEPSKIAPQLAGFGKVAATGDFSFSQNGDIISVRRIDAVLTESGTAVFSVKTEKEISVNIKNPRGNFELGTITASIPARLAAKFVPNLNISSDDLRAKFAVSVTEKGGFAVESVSPASITSLTVSEGENKIVERLNLFADAKVFVSPERTISGEAALRMAESKNSELVNTVKFSIDEKGAKFSLGVSGALSPLLSRIHSVSNYATQKLDAKGAASGAFSDGVLSLYAFTLSISEGAQHKRILTLDATRALTYDTKASAFSGGKSFLKIDASNVPFALVKPFAPKADAENVSLKGSLSYYGNTKIVGGEFSAGMKAFRYADGGKEYARNLGASAEFSFEFDSAKNELKCDILKLLAGEGDSNGLAGSAKLDFDVGKRTLNELLFDVSVSLPQILGQPVFFDFNNVSNGTLQASGKLVKDTLNAQIRAANLSARSARGKLETLTADVSAYFGKPMKLGCSMRAASTLGESRARLDASYGDKAVVSLDAQSLVFEDCVVLMNAFKRADAEAAKNAADAAKEGKTYSGAVKTVRPKEALPARRADTFAKKDTAAFWYIGLPFEASLKISKLYREGDIALENAELRMTADAAKLQLSKLGANVLGARLDGSLSASFDKSREIPYLMPKSSFALKNFDVVKVSADKSKPFMTGVFDASLTVEGSGNNAEHLFKYLMGTASFSNKNGGTIRFIDQNTVIGAATTAAGTSMQIVGSLLNNKVKEIGAIGDLIKIVSKLNYTSADFSITRSKDYNFKIERGELATSDFLISANSGVIEFNPAAPLGEQVLDIPVTIFIAKGRIRTMFQDLGLASTAEDSRGYCTGPAFKITGTIQAPENNLLAVLTGRSQQKQTDISKIDFFKLLK